MKSVSIIAKLKKNKAINFMLSQLRFSSENARQSAILKGKIREKYNDTF